MQCSIAYPQLLCYQVLQAIKKFASQVAPLKRFAESDFLKNDFPLAVKNFKSAKALLVEGVLTFSLQEIVANPKNMNKQAKEAIRNALGDMANIPEELVHPVLLKEARQVVANK